MEQVRVRGGYQITLPGRIAEDAKLKTVDVLDVYCRNGRIVLNTSGSGKTAGSVMDYACITRGVWGRTAEETQAELAR